MKSSLNTNNYNKNKEEKNSGFSKDSQFFEMNKQYLLSNIEIREFPSEINNTMNSNLLNNCEIEYNLNMSGVNSKINNKEDKFSILDNIKYEGNNKDSIENKRLKEASIRLSFEKLMKSDQFGENYILIPSTNIHYYNNIYKLPYSKPFDDKILLKDESLFFTFDNNYKNKFLSIDDIKKIKKEEINLNFGIDPYDIYGQLKEGKIHRHDKTSIEFYNSMNNFNIFKSRDPNYMNICMYDDNSNGNEDDNTNLITNNNNYVNSMIDPTIGNNIIFTKSFNTHITHNNKNNCKGDQKSSSIIIKENNFYFNNEKNDMKDKEENNDKGKENENGYQFIKKKRKINGK